MPCAGQSAGVIHCLCELIRSELFRAEMNAKISFVFFVATIRALTINNCYKMSCQIDVILNETIIVITEFSCFLSLFDLCYAIFIFVYTLLVYHAFLLYNLKVDVDH